MRFLWNILTLLVLVVFFETSLLPNSINAKKQEQPKLAHTSSDSALQETRV